MQNVTYMSNQPTPVRMAEGNALVRSANHRMIAYMAPLKYGSRSMGGSDGVGGGNGNIIPVSGTQRNGDYSNNGLSTPPPSSITGMANPKLLTGDRGPSNVPVSPQSLLPNLPTIVSSNVVDLRTERQKALEAGCGGGEMSWWIDENKTLVAAALIGLAFYVFKR